MNKDKLKRLNELDEQIDELDIIIDKMTAHLEPECIDIFMNHDEEDCINIKDNDTAKRVSQSIYNTLCEIKRSLIKKFEEM